MKPADIRYPACWPDDDRALRLRPVERVMIDLTLHDGQSPRVAARRLGLTLPELTRRLARALRKLDRELRRGGVGP